MSSLQSTLYTIGLTLLFIFSITTTLSFLSISIESYAIYLMWFITMVLFYLVLPSKTRNIFL